VLAAWPVDTRAGLPVDVPDQPPVTVPSWHDLGSRTRGE
jgi:hypothetical protein